MKKKCLQLVIGNENDPNEQVEANTETNLNFSQDSNEPSLDQTDDFLKDLFESTNNKELLNIINYFNQPNEGSDFSFKWYLPYTGSK